jgi:hypothetical protein
LDIHAQTAIQKLDGDWYSTEWRYGYKLKDGVGIATSTNSPNFNIGQNIIQLSATSATTFVGQQVYKDGKFYKISVTLTPDGRLYFEGEKSARWYMSRTDTNRPAITATLPNTNVTSSNVAASFDKTGLIDLKNEGTKRGSCVAVGSLLQISTNSIALGIMQRPVEGQDGFWKRQKEADMFFELGRSAKYLSEVMSDGVTRHVPPSQMSDYLEQRVEGLRRAQNARYQDPWIEIKAWDFCRKIIKF